MLDCSDEWRRWAYSYCISFLAVPSELAAMDGRNYAENASDHFADRAAVPFVPDGLDYSQ